MKMSYLNYLQAQQIKQSQSLTDLSEFGHSYAREWYDYSVSPLAHHPLGFGGY